MNKGQKETDEIQVAIAVVINQLTYGSIPIHDINGVMTLLALPLLACQL